MVLVHRDGSHVYVLVHMSVIRHEHEARGWALSLQPLPDTNQPPPFQEGVDLDEHVILHGYKPPTKEARVNE